MLSDSEVLQSLEDCHATLRIEMSGDHEHGFVKQPDASVFFCWSVHACLGTDFDLIRDGHWHIRIHLFSIHVNHALRNHLLSLASRCNAHPRQSFGQPLSLLEILESAEVDELVEWFLQRFLRLFFRQLLQLLVQIVGL